MIDPRTFEEVIQKWKRRSEAAEDELAHLKNAIPSMDLSRCSQDFLIMMVSNQYEMIEELRAERDRYRELCKAVTADEFSGIFCRNIRGVNWFDVREELEVKP